MAARFVRAAIEARTSAPMSWVRFGSKFRTKRIWSSFDKARIAASAALSIRVAAAKVSTASTALSTDGVGSKAERWRGGGGGPQAPGGGGGGTASRGARHLPHAAQSGRFRGVPQAAQVQCVDAATGEEPQATVGGGGGSARGGGGGGA